MKSGKRNTLWICSLLLPPVLAVGVPSVIAAAAGELFNLTDAVEVQDRASGEMLFGVAYSSPDTPYKFTRIRQEKAEILVVGSSRTLDMRREFFKPGRSFYNGGRLSNDVWVTRQALERLPPDTLPKHLLLALDQYDFNSSCSDYESDLITPEIAEAKFTDGEDRWGRLARVWPSVLKDLTRGKIHLRGDDAAPGIGMAAMMQASGFRKDGSYRYGAVIDVPPSGRSTDARLADTFERIEESDDSFIHGDSIKTESVEEVERLLAWCASRKIRVIGYLPAYAPSVVAEMRETPTRYGYMDGLAARLSGIFTRHGFQLHDFTNVEGATDEQFIDGFHSSERVAGHMLLRMAGTDPRAAEIIDTESIRSLLSASTDPLVLVP
ncbi:MAG: hypothetical protein KF712_07900 [Akkermansiaceae bacterium]|nr:hypothetical protein [Akkermansiaceae bacterium]